MVFQSTLFLKKIRNFIKAGQKEKMGTGIGHYHLFIGCQGAMTETMKLSLQMGKATR